MAIDDGSGGVVNPVGDLEILDYDIVWRSSGSYYVLELEFQMGTSVSSTYFDFNVFINGAWRFYSNLNGNPDSNGICTANLILNNDYFNINEYILHFNVAETGSESWSPPITISNESEPSGDYSYYPSTVPDPTFQWVYRNGNYRGEAETCVANTLATIRQHQVYLLTGERINFSIPWVFGNRHPSDDLGDAGMYYDYALDMLTSDGIPPAEKMMEYYNYHEDYLNDRNNNYFPDTNFYDDWSRYAGSETMADESRYALSQIAEGYRIAGYQTYDHHLKYVDDIKNAIRNEGAVMLNYLIDPNTYSSGDITNDGVFPPANMTNGAGHALAVVGWDTINGKTHWYCVGSWGDNWGDNGYAYVPCDYPFIRNIYVPYNRIPDPPEPPTSNATLVERDKDLTSITVEITNLSSPANQYDQFRIVVDGINYTWVSGNTNYSTYHTVNNLEPDTEYVVKGFATWNGIEYALQPITIRTESGATNAPYVSKRVDGGFELTWNNVEADEYNLFYGNQEDSLWRWDSIYDIFTNSYTLTGLTYGGSTGFFIRSWYGNLHADSPTSYATVNPQTPTITVGNVGADTITINVSSLSGFSDRVWVWCEGVGMKYTTSGGSVTFSGLQNDREYRFTSRSEKDTESGTTIESLGYGEVYATTQLGRPDEHSHFTIVERLDSSGSVYYETIYASEWTDFQNKINEFRVWKLGTGMEYSFSNVSSGDDLHATLYRQARNAINDLNPTISIPPYRDSGDDIHSSDFRGLVDSLNSVQK